MIKTLEKQLDQFLGEAYQAYHTEKSQNKPFKVLIIGKTGVGKSTLINALFGEYLSKTGVGKPVTKTIAQYEKTGFPICVYDTPGLEMYAETNEQIKQDVARLISSGNPENRDGQINIVWYCLSNAANRYEKSEEDWLREISHKGIPIILVLTKTLSPKHSEFLAYLKNQNLPVEEIIPILAQPLQITEEYIAPAYGLENLINATANLLQDSVRRTLISNQIVDINLQEREAVRYVDEYLKSLDLTKTSKTQVSQFIKEEAMILGTITFIFGLDIDENLLSILFNLIKKFLRQIFKVKSNPLLVLEILTAICWTYIDVLKIQKRAQLENKGTTQEELIKINYNTLEDIYKKNIEKSKTRKDS